MTDDDTIQVEVAYALPDEQMIIPVRVSRGCTAYEAVIRSGIVEHFPQIDPESAKMGIFSRLIPKPKETELQEGDRVEIYRPLQLDPKAARAARVKKAKEKREGEPDAD